MVTCSICNKELTDPTSVMRGIGPECIINYKNQCVNQQNLFAMRARYKYEMVGDVLMLEDLGGHKSLTNDMETALDEIAETLGGIDQYKIMYKDSFGEWDGVKYKNGHVEFFSIGGTSVWAALDKLIRMGNV